MANTSLVPRIAAEVSEELVRSLERHAPEIAALKDEEQPEYLAPAALCWALAVQVVFSEQDISDEQALEAFYKTLLAVRAAAEKGRGTVTLTVVDVSPPKAKA